MPSPSVWTPYTPCASMPGSGGRTGVAPVAITSWSNGSVTSSARIERRGR